MTRRSSSDDDGLGCLVIIVLAVVIYIGNSIGWYTFGALVGLFVMTLIALAVYRRRKTEQLARIQQAEREEAERERREREEAERQRKREEHTIRQRRIRQEEAARREHEEAARKKREEDRARREREEAEWKRKREEAARREREDRERAVREVMGRDTTAESVHYMSGTQFERFMATFLEMQGYGVETTKASGDQGVDLLLTDPDGRRVAAQLKRYTRPVGNKAVQEVFAGRFHYKANDAWVIATTSFTKGAYEAAKSTGVRLIDGDELAEWLREAGEELRGPNRPESDLPTDLPLREDRGVWHPHPRGPRREGS